jgi:hypothetical protein
MYVYFLSHKPNLDVTLTHRSKNGCLSMRGQNEEEPVSNLFTVSFLRC